jgi:hypothetical protein
MSQPDFKLLKLKVLLAVALLAASGLLISSWAAYAQSPSPLAVETNIPGIYAYTQPPEGFDPMTASAAELKLYGYPPRPGTDQSDQALAVWKAAVNPALRRVVPKLVKTNIYHRPASGLAIDNAQNASSSNWSGYALVETKATFPSVAGAWMVPVVQPSFGAPCSGEVYYSSQWVGIDGFSNSELFQAGSNTAVVCVDNTLETSYVPWVEWLPAAQATLTESNGSALPFAPGDYVIVMVTATNWSNGESSTGELYFADVTQNWVISGTLTAASIGGTYVVGRSAEWIVERPEINGELSSLANYIADPWSSATAGGFTNTAYAPGVPRSAKVYNITMLDNNQQAISKVTLFSPDALWFFDEGSALNY